VTGDEQVRGRYHRKQEDTTGEKKRTRITIPTPPLAKNLRRTMKKRNIQR
jgi:hypothetical protein